MSTAYPGQTTEQSFVQPVAVIKKGRDRPIRQRHPWIFSGSIRTLPSIESAPDGSIVSVVAHDGEWLAQGYLNRRSQIQIRLLSWEQGEEIEEMFWRLRLEDAIALRQPLMDDPATTAFRLVHAESDFLPGLTVDRYGETLVMQIGTLGMEQRKQEIAAILLELTDCTSILERSDSPLRQREGLEPIIGSLLGKPPDTVEIMENGQHFLVDLYDGQKTGFYLDQRENRQKVARYCMGKSVLNAFSYTGGFSVYALAAGAERIVNIDTSIEALEFGEENLQRNGFDPEEAPVENVAGSVFEILRDWRSFGSIDLALDPAQASKEHEYLSAEFDVVILDPPKFAQSKNQLDGALRGYKDINLLAMQILKPRGILATFSCSGLVDADLFQKVIFGAAVDADRDVQIIERLAQPSDHPAAITFPEGAYLKGLICRVL